MRSFIVMAMFAASLGHAGWTDYEEVRRLEIDVGKIKILSIDAGAGSMDVTGVDGLGQIAVTATIVVPDSDEADALKVIEKRMVLSLQENHGEAVLKSKFDHGFMGFSSNARIDLEVSLPQGMAVRIDDGSGSIDVNATMADVSIDDGSGSIDVSVAANVNIDDGSGSIDIRTATGDVFIVDGSGSIEVEQVGGSVTIDDGSGGIRVSDVENDLIITDDGSGGLSFSNVRGDVEQET